MKKIALLTLLTLSSCASIIDGSSQTVELRTEPNVPANCTISGSVDGTSVDAPGEIIVTKSYYPKEITCTPKAGGKAGTAKVLSDVAPIGYGGAVLGTAIGAGVDTYTGAAFKYPDEIVVKLGETTEIGKTNLN